jgi:hypothetical protein
MVLGQILRITLLSLLFAASSHAGLYKWTDDKGQVHYSDTQPDKEKAQQLNPTTSLPSGVEKEQSAFDKQVEDMNKRLAEEKKQQQEADKKAEEQEMIKKRCQTLRENMQVLVTKNRASKIVDGKRVIIPYEERVEKMEKIRKEMDEFCK